ncbi:MAG: class I SAM-dependent methyltransferase [Janthinobacterium lividum]
MKSTVQQIRERFDADVERFSNLETGQSATVDVPLVLELITQAAAAATPNAQAVLDIGCGAGNNTLKLLQRLPHLDCTLNDLSLPMLTRAQERVSAATSGTVTLEQGDIREIDLGTAQFDIVLAAAVLHHLRDDEEWRAVFTKLFHCLKPVGSLWISDLVTHTNPTVQVLMWQRYGEYLTELQNEAYRDKVFAYIDLEDTPRPLLFQLDLLREVGFREVELLHKNSSFAAFGAIK